MVTLQALRVQQSHALSTGLPRVCRPAIYGAAAGAGACADKIALFMFTCKLFTIGHGVDEILSPCPNIWGLEKVIGLTLGGWGFFTIFCGTAYLFL